MSQLKNRIVTSLSRRRFLQSAAAAVCLPVIPNVFAADINRVGRRLVLVELAGANDGLNTLVPYSDERYAELRPSLALKPVDLISIDSDFALNSAMSGLMDVWEEGEMAAIHGLGYPQPNRSHFKSMAIWETGGDGHRQQRNGWMTHAVEHAFASKQVDAHGISFGGGMSVFSSDSGNWLSLNTARQLLASVQPANQSFETDTSQNNAALESVIERTMQLQSSLDKFRHKLENSKYRSRIAGGRLAKQLNHVVNLINAGIETPVYKVSLGGFDTHENQQRRHSRLLNELGASLAGFKQELQKTGEWDNTVVMTYSEFGRRARENLSGGTDHGTAAPHFVTGGAVRGGLYGKAPDLGDLDNDDLKHTMDYRSLYAAMLENWLQVGNSKFNQYQDTRLRGLLRDTG